jgi:transposase-like protein
MKSHEQETKPQRNKYSPQFKEQALERAKQDGVPKAAKDLGLAQAMLYSWQAKARQTGVPFEEQKPGKPRWPGSGARTPGSRRRWPS